MSVITMPSQRSLPGTDVEQVGRLAVTLSGQFARIHHVEIGVAFAQALTQLAAATRVEVCQLIEFGESGEVTRLHVPTGAANVSDGLNAMPAPEAWLVQRLSRGELVAVSRSDDLPQDATAERERARRAGNSSILGVPALGRRAGDLCARARERATAAAMAPGAARTPPASRGGSRRGVAAPSPGERVAVQRRGHQAAERAPPDGQPVPEGRDQGLSRLRGHRRRQRAASSRVVAPGAGGADELERAAAGPDRDRQGTVRPGAARTEPPAFATARASQLRRASADTRGKRAVRS